MTGDDTGKRFELQLGETTIGRRDPSGEFIPDIDLEAYDPEAKVSRKHALIIVSENTVQIEDLGSLNGTYLNRAVHLTAKERQNLVHGDEIIIGTAAFCLEIINS